MFCEDIGVLQVILIVKKILDIVKIVIPIGLIVMVMIDFAKASISGEKGGKEATAKATKRIAAAVIIFFIPFVIDLIIDIVDDSLKRRDDLSGLKVHVTSCWKNANQATINEYAKCLKSEDTKGNFGYCMCLANGNDDCNQFLKNLEP